MTGSVDVLRDEAYRLFLSGDMTAAERLCHRILAEQPGFADAVYLLGLVAQNAGDLLLAEGFLRQACRLAPENAVFLNALGEVCLARGQTDAAFSSFEQSVASQPGYARAHNNLGRMRWAAGDAAGAEAAFSEAVRLNPDYATAHNNLGAVAQARFRLDEARHHFERAISIRPNYPEAHFNLGALRQARGDSVSAVAYFREAIRLQPGYARAHLHLGQALESLRRDYEALAAYETAAQLAPNDAEVHKRLGDLLTVKGDMPAALRALQRAVDLRPSDPEMFARLVAARHLVCDWRSYSADVERLGTDLDQAIASGESPAVSPFQALTLPWPRARLRMVAECHCNAVVWHQQQSGLRPFTNHPRTREGRLRVGYLSGDFYNHPIAHLFQGVFERHDRSRIEVFAYAFGKRDDSAYRRRIEAGCEQFVDVSALSVAELAGRIATDGVHILVDLMGHTGINRLGVLALQPAPIQVSLIGMLGTMGAHFIDYVITDRIVTPPEYAPDFVEQLVTMPDCYLVGEPHTNQVGGSIHRVALGLPETGFVFCSFNSAYKLEPRMFDVWMRVLSQVPGSVLWLLSNGQLLEDNLRREASARGVAPERLVFASLVPLPEHLARHRAADLFLDTLLYNAAATAAVSLQAGVPVLTCLGDTFGSRVGASIVTAAGLPELVAQSLAEYEHLAIKLANRPDLLGACRTRLTVPSTLRVFDVPRFVRHLEFAYQEMWNCFAAGLPPRPMSVPTIDSENRSR